MKLPLHLRHNANNRLFVLAQSGRGAPSIAAAMLWTAAASAFVGTNRARFSRILLLIALVLAVSELCSAQTAPSFEVASIRPTGAGVSGEGSCQGSDTRLDPRRTPPPLGQCVVTGGYLFYLVRIAYERELTIPLPPDQIVTGGPGWAYTDKFDVHAKAENPSTATERQLQQMLQSLLVERFKLKLHRATKEVQGYALVVSKGGPKLQPSKEEDYPRIIGGDATIALRSTVGRNASMRGLAGSLTNLGLGPVVDQTGLDGRYDFEFSFDRDLLGNPKGESAPTPAPQSGPSIFSALEESLGLRLVPQKVHAEYFVIDSAEKPTEN